MTDSERIADLQACNARQAERITRMAAAAKLAIELTLDLGRTTGCRIRTVLQSAMPGGSERIKVEQGVHIPISTAWGNVDHHPIGTP